VIAAGGIGSRFASGGTIKHKQCLILGGKPIYMWSVLTFLANQRIGRIVLVSHADVIEEIKEELTAHLRLRGTREMERVCATIEVIPGGETRQESVYLGLQHLQAQASAPEFVLIHDAARPFVRQSVIDATIESVMKHGACTVALPVSDTIKRVSDGTITDTIDRASLYAVHTPQAGRLDWLMEAHDDAARKNIAATDDAFILERMNHDVKIVPSDRYNIKVTVPEDMLICEAISHMFISQIMDV